MKKLLGASGILLLSFLLISPLVIAASQTSQGYGSSTQIAVGSLVSVKESSSEQVELSQAANRARLIGVVVNPQDSLVTFADGGDRVQVASSGVVSASVSDINGPIKAGDALTVSPIDGVGMHASATGKIFGTARQDFDANRNDNTSAEVTDKTGKKTVVAIGKIDVQVAVQDWTAPGNASSALLENLRGFTSGIAGKTVTNTQALLSVSIVTLAVVVSGIILYSAVSSSIHSVGRNPLSKGIVRRGFVGMIVLCIFIMVGALAAVYLIIGG